MGESWLSVVSSVVEMSCTSVVAHDFMVVLCRSETFFFSWLLERSPPYLP